MVYIWLHLRNHYYDLLCLEYGNAIGFVSWWLFATPITFLLVLWVNELKPNKNKILAK
jgi:hypothetical protein